VERRGNKFVISFSTSAKCDATVAVLDKDGRVVRHLASGLLGPNTPKPFRKDSLAQELEWDGGDDTGKPVPAGCRVRVQLGLRPEFARMLFEQPQGLSSRGPLGAVVGRDGLLYIEEGDTYIEENGLAGALQKLNVKVFDGDGNYLRTLVPFRGDWPTEKVSEVQFVATRDGRRVPLALSGGNFSYGGFLPGAAKTVRNTPLITSDGRLIYPCGTLVRGKRRLLVVGIDGSARKETFAGPPLQAEAKVCAQIFMALSPDEKHLYFAGARSKREKGSALTQAVYRTTLDAADFAKLFIGREFEPGKAEGQFNDPRGVDVDPKERIWVCDYMNDRIQVFNAEGKFLKAFDVPGPDQVRVHAATGAVYVMSVRDRGATSSAWGATWENYEDKSVIKFASFDDWKEVARLDLPKRKINMHDPAAMLALDTTRNESILWIVIPGSTAGKEFVWKVVDRGDKLERVPHKMIFSMGHSGGTPVLAADRARNELLAGAVRVNPATGETRPVPLEGKPGKAALSSLGGVTVGPDGLRYFRSGITLQNLEKIWRIRRFDGEGKLVPFKDGREYIEANANHATTPFNDKGTSFAVGPDGRIYVVSAVSRQTRDVHVDVYGPDGELVTPGLIAMTKSGGCIRVDRAGRIYASDTVRPKELSMPECYPSDPLGALARWYGTVFRYDQTGGGVSPSDEAGATHMAGGMEEKLRPVTMKGALWGFHGLAPMPLQTGCQCMTEHTAFDADGWGRLWVPDAPGFCVAVLDSAGNVMTRFGTYGNRDATGAGGAVPEPPIPLWYPFDVAVLDGDAFVRDMLSSRIVQVKLNCAQQAEVPVP
jgi:hypothetical protein